MIWHRDITPLARLLKRKRGYVIKVVARKPSVVPVGQIFEGTLEVRVGSFLRCGLLAITPKLLTWAKDGDDLLVRTKDGEWRVVFE